MTDIILENQSKIVNEELLNIDKSLVTVVKSIMKGMYNYGKIEPLGYREYTPSCEEIYDEFIEEYAYKMNKDKLNKTVSVNRTSLVALQFWFILDKEFAHNKNEALGNTPPTWDSIKGTLTEVYPSDLMDDVLANAKGLRGTVDMTLNGSLLFDVILLVPRIMNGKYFLINGLKYFPNFGRNSILTYNPKSDSVSIDFNRVSFSRVVFGENEEKKPIILNVKYGVSANPMEDINIYNEFFDIFKDYVFKTPVGKARAKSERAKALANSYNMITPKMVAGMKQQRATYDVSMLIQGIKVLIDKESTDYYSLHQGMISFLRTKIYTYIKTVGNTRAGRHLKSIKSKNKLRSHLIVSTVKKDKTYSMTSSVNDRDLHESFRYLKIRYNKSGKIVNESARARIVDKDEMAYLDPIKTTSSTNVGLTGCLTFSAKGVFKKDDNTMI